jgi:hypothetical protein
MQQGHSEQRLEASGQPFPAHNHAAVLALTPATGALDLEARDVLPDGAPTQLSVLPYLFRELGPNPAGTKAMAQVSGVIASIRRQHLELCARSAAWAGADAERIQPRHDLGPLVTIGRRRARGQRHTSPVHETVDENACAVSIIPDALTTPCARGKRSHPPYHTATASARGPRPPRADRLA